VNAPDKDGNTPLHETTSQDTARALIENGADVNARNHAHQTPLIVTWSEEVAKVLIHAGADLSAVDDQGRTALETARSNGLQSKIEVLQSALRGQAKK
jgi:ankyrin repeat protein